MRRIISDICLQRNRDRLLSFSVSQSDTGRAQSHSRVGFHRSSQSPESLDPTVEMRVEGGDPELLPGGGLVFVLFLSSPIVTGADSFLASGGKQMETPRRIAV
ncbi:uncharacterized protein EI97DRAFT_280320 [Westerdykella ornata]|uniref:Uncharacterized protein n=1 Tax=Westerdykella ornata TaxID=318751 RepID=A0A6A6JMW2_WESOR|nr:uncharacterized protein EI97DRAFT_280320 [Westerdykella ornata]KAF2277990.1 hypothetical protein EI97DRAFT_280320 [Westerdykella ornata]